MHCFGALTAVWCAGYSYTVQGKTMSTSDRETLTRFSDLVARMESRNPKGITYHIAETERRMIGELARSKSLSTTQGLRRFADAWDTEHMQRTWRVAPLCFTLIVGGVLNQSNPKALPKMYAGLVRSEGFLDRHGIPVTVFWKKESGKNVLKVRQLKPPSTGRTYPLAAMLTRFGL